MKQMEQNSNAGFGLDEFSTMSDIIRTYTLGLIKPQNQESQRTAPDAIRSLEKTKDSLVYAYLAANLHYKNIPLKEFIDDLEKNILLACLRLTHGSQRNAADLLSLKPTALFEKMRKHGINGKRIKLSEKLEAVQSRETA
jgi:DNA-binding NtrC family response regulator